MSEHKVVVGYEVYSYNLAGKPIPLTISQAPPRFYLSVLNTLGMDESSTWLLTIKSSYTLQCSNPEASIFTYDYERNPANVYPEAHLHIHGKCDMLKRMLKMCDRKKDKPADLHLPVGGRRYRPCLEDIIEFCILERLVDHRDTWRDTLRRFRDMYYRQQLQAAIRRDPGIVTEALNAGLTDSA